MNEYKISFTAFVDSADGTERHARNGWLVIDLEDDAEAKRYAEWNDDGLVDVDFLDPGLGFASAANHRVKGGEGVRVDDDECFFSAVITKVERTMPIRISDQTPAFVSVGE